MKPYKCKTCGDENPLNFYGRRKGWCRSCEKAYHRNYYWTNESERQKNAERGRRRRASGKKVDPKKTYEYIRRYRAKHPDRVILSRKKQRDKLSTWYVRETIGTGNIPSELIELKRLYLTAKRMLRNGNYQNNQ